MRVSKDKSVGGLSESRTTGLRSLHTYPSKPPVPAEREEQDLLEPNPHQRPVLERLGVKRHRAARSHQRQRGKSK